MKCCIKVLFKIGEKWAVQPEESSQDVEAGTATLNVTVITNVAQRTVTLTSTVTPPVGGSASDVTLLTKEAEIKKPQTVVPVKFQVAGSVIAGTYQVDLCINT